MPKQKRKAYLRLAAKLVPSSKSHELCNTSAM